MEELYITKKQVVNIISDYIQPLMTENGFTWYKSKEEFIKKSKFENLYLSFAIVNFWPLKQDYKISLSVKFNQFQSIKALFSHNKETKNHSTIYKSLILNNSYELGFKELYTTVDIEIAKKESFDLIKKEAFVFFDEFSNLDSYVEDCKNSFFKYYLFNSLIEYVILLKLTFNLIDYENIRKNFLYFAQKSETTDYEFLTEEEKVIKLKKLFDYLDNLKN